MACARSRAGIGHCKRLTRHDAGQPGDTDTSTMNKPPADTASERRTARPAWIKALLILLASGALGTYMWQQLPGAAYPTDLSRVGSGTLTLVLAKDGGFLGGAAVMELMNQVRTDYAGRVDFLVAPLKLAEGASFAARFGARDGTVVVFDGQGRALAQMNQPPDTQTLRAMLDKALAQAQHPSGAEQARQ